MTDFNKLFAGMPGMDKLLAGMPGMDKLMAGMPGVNPEALAASQKRNLDTMVQAGQVIANGAQAALAKQVAALQTMVQDGTAVLQSMWGTKDLQAGLKTQYEFMTAAQQKAMALATEIAEITQKTSQEAFEILRKRAEDTAAEVVAFQKKKAA
jgi:phasin family protein